MRDIAMMTLKRFKVTNFRSIMDSGWIDCDSVTSLIGINEAGKSNMILALWKLNPVRDGEINLLADFPIDKYTEWRNATEKISFISADFELDTDLTNKISSYNFDASDISIVNIQRYFDGNYLVSFPNFKQKENITKNIIESIIADAIDSLKLLNEKTKSEIGIKELIADTYIKINQHLSTKDSLDSSCFDHIKSLYPPSSKLTRAASSEIFPHFEKVKESIKTAFSVLNKPDPADNNNIVELILKEMPSFIYYSNYGNLDAQIYLPHVIKWLNGEEVDGIKNEAKVRTLRVLFDFVKLKPQEVLELGKDPQRTITRNGIQQATEESIETTIENKYERTVMLNSASTKLTQDFKEWWKQGNYNFRLQADGEVFIIWVADDKRPSEIELEKRSTGLQWFLCFFLVFLVESQKAHKGAIILLDEAGLSLHPLAQKDLIDFFDNLSKKNQIIYTTHSPFLIDTSHIDRAKAVFLDKNGLTVASSDLRASDDKLNVKSIYAAHAALGLSVSEIMLQGCKPIIVEGPSDQHYLNAIKIYLVKNKIYAPNTELVFVPSGGVKGVSGVASIVSSKNDDLPLVILDSDKSGLDAKNKLESGLYRDSIELIITTKDLLELENSEIEDLIPLSLMIRPLDRLFRDIEDESFKDFYVKDQTILPQIKNFALKHKITLSTGWKVDLARSVKKELLKTKDEIPKDYVDIWEKLFNRFND
ncbi:AAA family ATPase [Selenomonadales bacterium OttesenSCG-928-I06]|nr:AAA family ATPase [Selenomonadales bacterium OttesenSCG-928-I06]